MALGKGVYVIHQSGKWYTNENSDHMLMERHMPPIRYYLLNFLVLIIMVSTEETFDEIFALLYDCYTNITLMSETDEKYHKELYKEYKL